LLLDPLVGPQPVVIPDVFFLTLAKMTLVQNQKMIRIIPGVNLKNLSSQRPLAFNRNWSFQYFYSTTSAGAGQKLSRI